jgi:DNA-directed RNA polymerase subunit RPC12/RpoP
MTVSKVSFSVEYECSKCGEHFHSLEGLDAHVRIRHPQEPRCIECGRSLEHSPQGWREQGVCSGRCWAILYGETDM